MQITLFGAPQVIVDNQPIKFRSDKIRALLGYLVVEGQTPIARSHLAALLWGELPDQTARTNLRVSLNRLRKSLGHAGNTLKATRQTVQFEMGGIRPIFSNSISFGSNADKYRKATGQPIYSVSRP